MSQDDPTAATNQPTTNLLDHSASSYLRSARHQPVQWHPWGEAAFARAKAEDKPILLDIGAVWCHWCHVMDRESYENPQIAALINDLFIAVKVDRDERPDVDTRYQAAVSAISGQGGWPLTAFLTPDGLPYFGGTYMPPEDRYGRPGFPRVLTTMAEVWHQRRDEALESAASVMAAIEQNENFTSPISSGPGPNGKQSLSRSLVEKIAASALSQFDPRNGGFGAQPKFPHPAALDLLLQIAMTRDPQNAETGQAREAFTVTLEKMSRGGIYDHLAGGFHRYSTDERWIVPHFEKMLYDNTELLRNYVHGYQSLNHEDFLITAREIVHWLDTTMTDRTLGGFYASQDADIDLDDDGDYFTWTQAEARAVLSPVEFDLASRYWDIGELGDMHHNPAKNVLHVKHSCGELGTKLNSGPSDSRPIDSSPTDSDLTVRQILDSARQKLLAARSERPTPFIDRTLYTGWNAMAVTAYLETAPVLGMDSARDFALLTLDRLLDSAWFPDPASNLPDGSTLYHVIAYAHVTADAAPPGIATQSERAPGTLDDYAFTLHAAIDAWFASGEMNYYRTAIQLADAMIARFYDSTGGGFYDSAQTPATQIDAQTSNAQASNMQVPNAQTQAVQIQAASQLGALTARRKPLQDSPTPAGNPTAASALLRLETLSGRPLYRQIAEQTLANFAGIVEHFGLYAGSYGVALERLLADPISVIVVGSGPEAERLEALAVARYAVNKTVMRIAPNRLVPDGIPEALAETLFQVPRPEGAEVWALVCHGHTCLPPITDAGALLQALQPQTLKPQS